MSVRGEPKIWVIATLESGLFRSEGSILINWEPLIYYLISISKRGLLLTAIYSLKLGSVVKSMGTIDVAGGSDGTWGTLPPLILLKSIKETKSIELIILK